MTLETIKTILRPIFPLAEGAIIKYSLKNELSFKMLQTSSEIEAFYEILCGNLRKFDAKPVHTLEQMLEFKEHRLKDVVEFYGVFHEERMIAGSMVFFIWTSGISYAVSCSRSKLPEAVSYELS